MIVETTLRKAMFLLMGTWVLQSDRESSRRRRELRKWILDNTAEERAKNSVEVLDRGGFSFGQNPGEAPYLPVEIDFTVEQLNILPTMFGRNVVWPNLPDDEQEEELDELEAEVTEWGKQEAAARALRTLTKKQRAKLDEDMQE